MITKPRTGAPSKSLSAEADLDLMRRIADASAMTTVGEEDQAELDRSAGELRDAISQADLSQRLLDAVERSATRNAASMEALRIAVCEFTMALRQDGTTPEGVLIALKAVIEQKSLPVFPRHITDRNGDNLRGTISTWCIKAYFSEQSGCV